MRLTAILALAAALALPAPGVQASDATLAQALAADARLSTLKRAIEAAGLGEALAAAPAVTVLAPTDAAFAELPAGTLDGLLAPERKTDLQQLLQRHVLTAAYAPNELKLRRSAPTLAGQDVKPSLVRGNLRINEQARVAPRGIPIANGYVLIIDKVLVP
jgi:uncharacterized surface protein with fasciclin (FAS1) repeats